MKAWEETWSLDAHGEILRVEREDESVDNIAEFMTHRWQSGDPKDFERARLAAAAPEMARILYDVFVGSGDDRIMAVLRRAGFVPSVRR